MATIAMISTKYHTHYDESGLQVPHPPGERYEISDGQGMTADQLANSFTSLGVAIREADSHDVIVKRQSRVVSKPTPVAPMSDTPTSVAPMTTDTMPITTKKTIP